jgi:hypothetical protein
MDLINCCISIFGCLSMLVVLFYLKVKSDLYFTRTTKQDKAYLWCGLFLYIKTFCVCVWGGWGGI